MSLDSAKSQVSRLDHPGTRTALAAVPVAAVNTVAFIGQFTFLHDHLKYGPAAVLVAATIESIAVFLSFHAHIAQMKNDSAARIKLGAYTIALIIGATNYSHYAGPHWRPTVLAVIFSLASVISPALWGVHSRRASRDALMDRGLIEERGVKLGFNRWLWHPVRCLRATSWAAWHGTNDPKVVLGHFENRYGTIDTPDRSRRTRTAVPDQVPRTAVEPARTTGLVRQEVPPAVPVQPVRAASVQAPDHYGVNNGQPSPGTVLNGHPVVRGEARLEAESVAAGPVTEQMIRNAALYLDGLPDGGPYPGERTLAGSYLGSQGRRRDARRLLEARRAAEVRQPVNGHAPDQRSPQMIATPLAQMPGGVSG